MTTILPRPDAPLGSVRTLPSYSVSDFPSSTAVLCRNTGPLIAFAFDLLARGVACHVVGKDIQIGLEKLIAKIKGDTISGFRMDLVRHMEYETEKLRRKGKKEAAGNFEDKCNAILAVAQKCNTKDEVKSKLTAIFASGDGLTLSTIHKSKGLEWPTVFLLDWHLLPSRFAETATALRQEKNLQYVAVTRAMVDLRFIESGRWKGN